MTIASLVALLQTALMLLQVAQGPAIDQTLRTHAIAIAQQAIGTATQSLTSGTQSAPPPTSGTTAATPVGGQTAAPSTGIVPPPVSGSTFYVDNTCQANGNGLSANCAQAANGTGTFNSLAAMTARSGGYAPGDQILLKRGTTYREMLVMPSSGIAGKPIRVGTYGDGARPIILGSDRRTWTPDTGGAFVAPVDWTPNLVFQGDAPLTRVASRAALAAGTFYHDASAGKMYVIPRSGMTPTDIEVARRPQNYYGLVMDGWTGNSWIEFDGLEVRNSNWMSFRIFGGKGVTVRNSVIKNGFHNAIIAMGSGQGAAADPDNLTIVDNSIANHGFARSQGHDGAAAISVDGSDGFMIQRNVIDTNYGEGIETYNTATNGNITGNTIRNQQISGALYVNASFGRKTSDILVKDNVMSGGNSNAHTALIVAIEGSGTIDRVTVTGNTVSGFPAGGGLVVGSGQGTISNSTFEGNTITTSLHGLEVLGQAGLTFSNNVFKGNSISLSSNGSALLVTAGGSVGNTFSGNTFSNPGTPLPIFWLGSYYPVADWQALIAPATPAPPVPPPAPTPTPTTPVASTSCVYGSNSGAVRTLSSADTKDSCISSCIAIRNTDFGVADSGVCTFTDTLGAQTQRAISAISCIYSSNTGTIKYAPVTTQTTKQSCLASCASTRDQYYGPSDTGVCLYYGSLGEQETMSL